MIRTLGARIVRRSFASAAYPAASTAVSPATYTPPKKEVPKIMNTEMLEDRLKVTWENNQAGEFNYTWLYDNADAMKTVSNQRKFREVKDLLEVKPSSVFTSEDQTAISLQFPDLENSAFTSEFLRRYNCSAENFAKKQEEMRHTQAKITKHAYEDVMTNEFALYNYLKAIMDNGFAIVTGMPTSAEFEDDGSENVHMRYPCAQVADRIARPHPGLYGIVFDVKSVPEPINVAFTSMRLEFHQDLVYYESSPGLQYLHANSFPEDIVGGESLLLDSIAAANEFREKDPESFEVMTRLCGSFHKDHSKGRKESLQMYLLRPHIVTQYGSEDVVAITWSPPFEAPFQGTADEAKEYYKAYAALQAHFNSDETLEKFGSEFKLSQGEMMVFNNKRTFHARKAFQDMGSSVRHLQGCYTDVDAFLNKFRILANKYEEKDYEYNGLAAPGEKRVGILHNR